MKRVITCAVSAVLFFLLPVKVRAAELIPVGQVIGLQLQSGSVSVVAYDENLGGYARAAGLKIGDEIIKIGDSAVTCAEDVRTALDGCDASLEVTVRRSGSEKTLTVTPKQTADGARLGIYLRQGIAGIGTVTFYDPETGLFGTLGHGVCDGKGTLLEMTGGSAYKASVQSVRRGRAGEPGQLKGSAETALGELQKNTPYGVFGVTDSGWSGETVSTADYEEICAGDAVIRATVTDRGPEEYSVEILKIYPQDRSDGRNFLIRITDPKLLSITGGIVQGMSGSPIIQDGKLVGAVTHVLVNDPTKGYGIFIENMLEAA